MHLHHDSKDNSALNALRNFFLCLSVLLTFTASVSTYWIVYAEDDISDVEDIKETEIIINESTDDIMADYSGSCGDNVEWSFSYSTHTLTISGSGEMNDYVSIIYSSGIAPWWKELQMAVENVVIENGITYIGNYAFQNLYNLTSISFPDSVVSIGNSAFDMCPKISELNLPKNLTSIGNYAFAQSNYTIPLSTKYKELTIPASVRTIGTCAFLNDGGIEKLTIENGVTSLGYGCFSGCKSLNGTLVLPDSITSIGDYCFTNTFNLDCVVLSASLTSIGRSTFCRSGIKCAVIPKSVTSIEGMAFYNCDDLEWISLPSSLNKVNSSAFYNCSNLNYVLYEGSSEQWNSVTVGSGNDSLTGASEFCYNLYNPFIDVHPSRFYFNPVLWALYHDPQVTTGTSFYTFSPDNTCTRGQVVTFLYRASGNPDIGAVSNPFKDVSETRFFYDAVLWAYSNGITTGTSKTAFSPDSTCTRGQVVTFLWRTAGKPEPVTTENPFTDVSENTFYYKAVLWAYENNITTGTSATTFSPNKTCTRGQVVTFLSRFAGV